MFILHSATLIFGRLRLMGSHELELHNIETSDIAIWLNRNFEFLSYSGNFEFLSYKYQILNKGELFTY